MMQSFSPLQRIHAFPILVSHLYLCTKTQALRIIAKRPLRDYWELNPVCEHNLTTWYKQASRAEWGSPNEVKEQYASASILKNGRVVFNISGNKYRLVVDINYERKWLFVRFIGTHKEYDKIDANNI